ncbi:glycoside hydrolase family 3 protein [Streptomyces paromomycinus]|uniref:beta-N-acetylhexosaminidase n=1 Tax=Streptomyces paromomycinus TaxID=92743 RepID=A0A401W8L9_STREY|nr:glycoside hydrolase family 3 protein [Streptomyces paromomycinus]GCD45652.1 beta-N-acetylhexosaminidase [Streptomyces paromomycinus]
MHSRRTVLTTAAAAACAMGTGGGAVHAVASGPRAAGAADARVRAARLVSRMNLEEKVGQLFVMRVYGHSATDPDPADAEANRKEMGVSNAAELVAKYHLGGIIYFGWAHNTRDPHQIADLSNGIQRAAAAQRVPVPLLISTDQEHGIVARIGAPATLFPGAMALGAGRSREDARTAGRIAGEELYAMGIRQDYAPVADVNVNPANPVIGVRSFGSEPKAVARLVTAQVQGYQRAGVAATAKHFPGHGDTDTDSHVGLPYIRHTAEEWERLDAPPFRAAIEAGIDSIMTAHIVVPAFDASEDPATLSRPILTGVLRERLGFDGVVVTDSLGMQGVRTKYGDARVPVLALKAGVDQLLNPPDIAVAFASVLKAVRTGELTERAIDEKLIRILLLKERRGLFDDPYTTHRAVERSVGTRRHLATADRIADRTTTLLVNDDGLLPLSRRAQRRLLVAGADAASPSGTGGPPTKVLAETFNQLGFTATALPTGTAPTQELIDRAVTALRTQDAAIVTTYNVTAASSQRALVEALLGTGKPVVQVAVRNPYDIAQLPGVRAALATYSWTDVELRAAARVIAGRRDPEGKLPVPVMRADAPGSVLHPVGHGLSY